MSVLPSRRGTRRSSAGLAQLGSWIQAIAIAVAVIIGIGILFVLIDANPRNDIVDLVNRIAGWLATPFADLLTISDSKTRQIANWGLAAIVYLLLGMLVGRMLVGRGLRWRR